MTCLDVAVGTGLVAREAVTLVGRSDAVIGLDPSPGMLAQAAKALTIRLVVGRAECLPFGDGSFDFLSMGYALRHDSDLSVTMREFFRVLRPGGRLCLLEITRPRWRVPLARPAGASRWRVPLARPAGASRWRVPLALLRCYMKGIVPYLSRWTSGGEQQRLLWEYYWDTINPCVPPATARAR
jgi:demethylmenaquinone methyltransferase/2-methoxy-6-polyprenyl-1,4-benzoquinol methylase